MKRGTPPLNWFRAFEASARHLSFTGAAGELHLTQSAVSQHVRSLELRFGVTLFERKPRGLALTDAGRRLLPDVGKALGTLVRLSQQFDIRPAGRSLTVATSASLAQWFLAPGLAGFQRAHPGVSVRIINTIWPDEYHQPLADVEIRFGPAATVGRNATRLEPDEIIAVAAPSLDVEVDNLDEVPLIEAVGTLDGWQAWADSTGYPNEVAPRLFVDSHGLAVDLARNGAGVALTSSLVAGPAIASGHLVRLNLPAKPGEDGYFLAINGDENPDAFAFAEWLQDTIRRSAKPAR